MTKQYRSRAIAWIHDTAEGLHAAGVMDKQTMCKFDEACAGEPTPEQEAEIQAVVDEVRKEMGRSKPA